MKKHTINKLLFGLLALASFQSYGSLNKVDHFKQLINSAKSKKDLREGKSAEDLRAIYDKLVTTYNRPLAKEWMVRYNELPETTSLASPAPPPPPYSLPASKPHSVIKLAPIVAPPLPPASPAPPLPPASPAPPPPPYSPAASKPHSVTKLATIAAIAPTVAAPDASEAAAAAKLRADTFDAGCATLYEILSDLDKKKKMGSLDPTDDKMIKSYMSVKEFIKTGKPYPTSAGGKKVLYDYYQETVKANLIQSYAMGRLGSPRKWDNNQKRADHRNTGNKRHRTRHTKAQTVRKGNRTQLHGNKRTRYTSGQSKRGVSAGRGCRKNRRKQSRRASGQSNDKSDHTGRGRRKNRRKRNKGKHKTHRNRDRRRR